MEEPGRYQKVKTHLQENKKYYIVGAGGVVVGASLATTFGLHRVGSFPVDINQTIKNTALIVWKPQNTNIALVKKACPDPIPVLDKLTGEGYSSLNRAAKVTGKTIRYISNDAQGLQERFERLPDSVFA